MIGDLHSAALVGRDGSIDWLCFPRFDSESCFSRLLGHEQHGFWRIAPVGAPASVTAVRRRYRPGTLVLETEFETEDGRIRVTDCMPIREDHPQVVRVVEGLSGRVPMQMDLVIRFGYGQGLPWVMQNDGLLTATAGPDALALFTRAETRGQDFRTVSEFTISEGQQVPFSLIYFPSHLTPPRPIDPWYAIATTTRVVGGLDGGVLVSGGLPGGRGPVVDHAQGADLRADRRDRRGRHDVATGEPRWVAQLGLPVLLAA